MSHAVHVDRTPILARLTYAVCDRFCVAVQLSAVKPQACNTETHWRAGRRLCRLDGCDRGVSIEGACRCPLKVQGNVLEALVRQALEGSPRIGRLAKLHKR